MPEWEKPKRPPPRWGDCGNPKPERQLFPSSPAEEECLLSSCPPAEEECLLVAPSEPHPSPASEGEPHPSPASEGEPHPSPASEGEPHPSPASEGEPHQSPATGGDYTLLPPSSPGDYTLLPPSSLGDRRVHAAPTSTASDRGGHKETSCL
ncbi:UNVERIFIED_CONTAM: hypothetical protein FKN15_053489 [Acipenser sinensis]